MGDGVKGSAPSAQSVKSRQMAHMLLLYSVMPRDQRLHRRKPAGFSSTTFERER